MATKSNNLAYDGPLEVRYWQHPAELAIIPEVENGTVYTAEVCTDGGKIGGNVGTAEIIFVNGKLIHQLNFKLHGHCSNNQAEQIAILKLLGKLEELQDGQDDDKCVAMCKVTLYLLQNTFKRNRLIEFIRNKIITLTLLKWIVHFDWVKGHARTRGNELVEGLTEEAAVEHGPVVYYKIPREVIVTREKENELQMWQQQWTNAGKGAVTTAFFPSVSNRLRQKTAAFPELQQWQQDMGN